MAWCCRQTQCGLDPAECPPGKQQSSEWQWTASVFTTSHGTRNSCSLFTADWCPVLSRSKLCRQLTLDHLFPHCAAAEHWFGTNCAKFSATEMKCMMQNKFLLMLWTEIPLQCVQQLTELSEVLEVSFRNPDNLQ